MSDGQRLMWRMTIPRERSFPLGFAMCVSYGGKVASLPRAEAASLQPGRGYNLHIEARPGAKGPAALVYQARFCLPRAD